MVVWVPGSMARTFSNRLAGPSQGEGFSSFPFFFFFRCYFLVLNEYTSDGRSRIPGPLPATRGMDEFQRES